MTSTVIAPAPLATSAAVRGRRPRGMWLAAGVPTLFTWVHSQAYGQWIVDDAGITFAYARSIATGAGPVLQPGVEPVEGYSNPAWLAVLIGGRWLGLFDHGTLLGQPDLVLFPKLVALACCFAMFAAFFTVACSVTGRPVLLTVAAGSATAAVPSFAIWTTSGLENALFTAAVVGIAALMARAVSDDRLLAMSTAVSVGLLAALAALARPDGIIYALAYPLVVVVLSARSWRAIRAVAVGTASWIGPVGAYLCYRLATFGDVLPNTARAKEQGAPGLSDLNRPLDLVEYVGLPTAALCLAVVVVALSRRSARSRVLVAILVPLVLAVAAFILLEADWMAQLRFATPVWPLGALVVAVSVAEAMDRICIQNYWRTTLLVTLVAIAGGHTLTQFATFTESFRRQPTVSMCAIALNTGYQINGYADILEIGSEGTLLAVDAGGSSLTSRLKFIDLAGLADRRIAELWQGGDTNGLRDHIFGEVRPTFIKLYSGWDHRERLALDQDSRFARDYVELLAQGPGGGEWVRRDAVPDEGSLVRAREWGVAALATINARFHDVIPAGWHCPDTLRPTPVGDGTPQPPL